MSRFESNPWSLERSFCEFREEFLDLMRGVRSSLDRILEKKD